MSPLETLAAQADGRWPAWDEALLRAMNAGAGEQPLLDAVMRAASSRVFWGGLLGALALLVALRRRRAGAAWLVAVWPALVLGAALGVSDLTAVRVVKPLVARVRPCHALEGIVAPAGCGPGKSFPSAHAANGFAAAGATVVLFGGTAGAAALVGASTAAVSRVYLGVHYPTDVAAGGALGLGVGVAVALAAGRLLRRLRFRAVASADPRSLPRARSGPRTRTRDPNA